jgi:hypothetical protein
VGRAEQQDHLVDILTGEGEGLPQRRAERRLHVEVVGDRSSEHDDAISTPGRAQQDCCTAEGGTARTDPKIA